MPIAQSWLLTLTAMEMSKSLPEPKWAALTLFGNLTDEPLGCGDETACNYEPEATALYGCQFDCYGCTQENADNYNPTSTIDDGSCLIPVDGCSNVSGIYSLCTDNNVDTVITYCPDEPENAIQMYILSGALENLADYLYVYDGADTTAALIGEPLTDQLNDNLFQATNPSGCLTIRVVTDISLGCTDGFFNPIKYILSCGYEAYLGCTDVSACNYDPDAVIDDGTCAEVDCQESVVVALCWTTSVACVDVNSLIDDSTLVSSSGTLEPVSGLEPVIYVKENYATNEPTNWIGSATMWCCSATTNRGCSMRFNRAGGKK